MTPDISRLRLIAVVVILSASAGCVSSREVPLASVANESRSVRVTLVDETYIHVHHATFVGDTLHGYTSRLSSRTSASYRSSVAIEIPASEISRVEVRHVRTVLALLTTGAVTGLAFFGDDILFMIGMLFTDGDF